MDITKHVDRITANASDLAAQYKYQGYDKFLAWDHFVIDRGLKPEMNAKEFYSLYASVSAAPLTRVVSVSFTPTHYDALLRMDCQITQDERGVYTIIWADGHTGTNPPAYPPEPERYKVSI